MDYYPLRLKPYTVEKIWGGTGISEFFPGKGIPSDKQIGESWELSARADHDSTVENGPYAGMTLTRLIARYGDELIGVRGLDPETGRFPLLLKFLDASRVLSVQVHPDDEYALRNENDLGKMEAWYILSSEPGASLIKGVKAGTTAEEFRTLLEEKRLEECLNSFEVSAGDIVFLPPRTLHAIGEGLMLFEIQQSSDVTYRAYDWGRTGMDGKPRELHVDQVLAVTDFSPPEENCVSVIREEGECVRTPLLDTRYFVLEEVIASEGFGMDISPACFMAVTCVKGSGMFSYAEEKNEHVRAGDTFLLPAGFTCSFMPEGTSTLLFSYVPPAEDWLRRS